MKEMGQEGGHIWQGDGSFGDNGIFQILNTFPDLICLLDSIWINTYRFGTSTSVTFVGVFSKARGQTFKRPELL